MDWHITPDIPNMSSEAWRTRLVVQCWPLPFSWQLPFLNSWHRHWGQPSPELCQWSLRQTQENGLWRPRPKGTNLLVYRADVLPTLLYGSELWTTYSRHERALEHHNQRSFRRFFISSVHVHTLKESQQAKEIPISRPSEETGASQSMLL